MCRSKVLCIFRHTMHAFVILIKKNGRKKKQKGFNLIFAGSFRLRYDLQVTALPKQYVFNLKK